ncbi:MAG: glycoside hydrolase family 55 protein, partial [Acidobacteriales bacterium]|nr:glycoside hydrolase family 55 protein [Terriglobales bacterium]
MPLSQITLTRRSMLGAAAFGLTGGTINVREKPYRAAANGRADDTPAIQRAMDDAHKRGGGIVFLPAGEYHIASHLAVPAGVSFMGVARAPQTWKRGVGSVLLAVEGAGKREGAPFITLDGNNATMEGLAVFYPNQTLSEEPVAYPWCIASGKQADNVAIVNCQLVNPYQGVDFATNSAHRHLITGLYGQPLLKG